MRCHGSENSSPTYCVGWCFRPGCSDLLGFPNAAPHAVFTLVRHMHWLSRPRVPPVYHVHLSVRRRFLRQRLAVQISIDLELFLGRFFSIGKCWECGEKPMEMSTMLAWIVHHHEFTFHRILLLNGFWKSVQGGVWSAAINQTNQIKFGGRWCGGPQRTRWFGDIWKIFEHIWNILKYIV